MLKINYFVRLFLIVCIYFSVLPNGYAVRAQDLVASESIAGGSSAFVFRESRKKPQAHLAGGYSFLREAGGRMAANTRSNAQIAAAARKRKLAAAAARKKAMIASANRKIALSNTLTAKAETSLDNNLADDAIKNFRAALVQNPKNIRASVGLSEALTAKGIEVAGETNSDAAVVHFNEAIKLDNNNAVAYAKLAAIYDAKGDNAKAITNYEKAITLDAELAPLNAPLGLAYVQTGEIAKAEICLRKADAAGADTVETRTLRGIIDFKQNKNAEAMTAFDRVLEIDGRNANAQYYRGQIYDRENKSDQMIAAYKKSLVLEPGFAPASYELGVAYYNAGDYKNAETAYQQAIKNDPKNGQAHANLASTYRQLERYPEANTEYNLASQTIKTADLYSEWGFCLGKTNEWDKAAERLKTAHDLSPTAIDNSNVGWAYYNAGATLAEQKNDAAAKTNFELGKSYSQRAVDQDPKLDAAYLNLGSTHNALGEFQLAVNALNAAIGLHRDWGLALNQLGVGYRGLNDLVNAVAAFKRVVDLDGNSVYGLFNLGEAYNASGDKKAAKKVQDKLRRINPSLAGRLDGILSGKAVVNSAKQKIENKLPRIPRLPY